MKIIKHIKHARDLLKGDTITSVDSDDEQYIIEEVHSCTFSCVSRELCGIVLLVKGGDLFCAYNRENLAPYWKELPNLV